MRHYYLVMALLLTPGCTPRIEIAASKEPVTINMNIKIDHDINIKATPGAEQLIHDAPQR